MSPLAARLGRHRTTIAVAGLLALAIAAAYANGLHIGFYFDDWHVLERNPAIRSLANIPRFFVDANTSSVLHENKDLRPILLVTFALNHAVSGDATWSYHVVNLALHWIVALLVFRIVRDHLWLAESRLPVAVVAALLVAVHPLNTEPVNYLSARSALLTAAFYLAAFDAAVRNRHIAAVALFAFALLTKAIAVTFPIVVVAHRLLARHRAPDGSHRPIPWTFIGVLVAVDAAGVLYRALLLPPWIVASTHDPSVSPWIYFMTGWSAYLYYLRLFLWPNALVIDRLDYPLARSFLAPQAWGSLVILIALGVLAWRIRRRLPALAFAAAWYAVTLASESTFFPLAEAVNEHRPYLAMLGLGTAAALGLWHLAGLVARRADAPPVWVLAVLAAALAGVLGAATAGRNETWRDDYTLWRDATEKAPENPRAWLNAGHAALALGDLDEARDFLLTARRLSPCYAYVQMNLSALEARQGDLEASLRWADEAVRCNPGRALAHYYRALALERLGRLDESLEEYRQTTAIDGHHADAWFAQGRLHERGERWAEAAAAYERAAAVNATHVEAAMLAGVVRHHRLGDPAGALTYYRRVLRLVPTHYGAHYQIATALLASGRDAEAREAWDAFVKLAEAVGDRASLEAAPATLRTPR
jgi:Tfp pilus assembly protein PilF